MKRTTTQKKIKPRLREIKELMAGEEDFLRPLVGLVVQEILDAGISVALEAQEGNEARHECATVSDQRCRCVGAISSPSTAGTPVIFRMRQIFRALL